MNFTSSMIVRYLRSRRGFTGVVTGFSVAGILLGVAALIVVMCVMAGFRDELISRILGMTGHATLAVEDMREEPLKSTTAALESLPEITEATPIVQGQVMITAGQKTTGSLVRGVALKHWPELVTQHILAGDLKNVEEGATVGIGRRMADHLNMGVGGVLTVLSPDGATTPFGFIPRIVHVKVGVVFETGMQAYDSGLLMMRTDLAQSLFRMGDEMSAVELRVKDPSQIQTVVPKIMEATSPYTQINTWQQSNQQFFAALKVERVTMFVILSLIILVAAFNIITGQIMLVGDKAADIAILRTMGATRRDILRIFLFNGLLLGLLGTLAGFVLGLTIVLNLKEIVSVIEALTGSKLFSGDVYPVDTIPALLVWPDIFAVLVMSLILTLFASLYPAWRAAKQQPVEALRHG